MKKNTWIWIGLSLSLAIAAYFISADQSGSTIEQNERDFAIEDTASVTKIFMADRNGRSVSLMKEDNIWVLENGIPAKKASIDLLLETMNRITVKSPVSKSGYERIIKNLATEGVKVEIYQNNSSKPSKVYYVGGPNPDHSGTYMLLEGASKPFVMHIEGFFGFLTPRYFVEAKEWELNEVFNYPYGSIESLTVDFPFEKDRGFQIRSTDSSRYELATPEGNLIPNFNAQRVVQYLALYRDLNFESYEKTKSEAFMDSVVNSIPYKTIKVVDEQQQTKVVKFYNKPMKAGAISLEGDSIQYDIDRAYIFINDEKFVIIQHFVFDKIETDRSFFLLSDEI